MSKAEYIELNRTFDELLHKAKSDDDEARELLFSVRKGKATDWKELLKEYRVIILAGSGTGKTWEIENIARQLNERGLPAFFIRLEHVTEDFENSFEVGEFADFESWLNSTNEGWLLLDSVDEARLKNPKDFESSIRKISSYLKSAMQRVHIVMTGRPHAWRPKTDLDLCNDKFPLAPSVRKEEEKFGNGDEDDFLDNDNVKSIRRTADEGAKDGASVFTIYSLSNLTSEQAETFIHAKKIKNSAAFLKEVEKKDVWKFIETPLALEETAEFWQKFERLGSPLELMRYSINRRMIERDQNRAEVNPLPLKRSTEGAQLLAVASTLVHENTIRVPDGDSSTGGIDAKSILTSWTETECLTLLSRRIFEEAIYGAVRFHHRSVREYLTAEWLSRVLQNHGSRMRIENLFFREQYGMTVITPSLKSILPWLAILDAKVRERILKIEPEVILEGGDPTQLPLPTRKEILASVCKKLFTRSSSPNVTDYASVQRFASADMADEIKRLFSEYAGNKEVTAFLLRMVWLGGIKEALPEVKKNVLNPKTERYTRMAAIRAVREIGSPENYKKILQSYASESGKHDRRVLADFVDGLDSSTFSVDWVTKCILKAEAREKLGSDSLSPSLIQFAKRLEVNLSAELLKGLMPFLEREPFIERRFCKVSKDYSWLMSSCVALIQKLITYRHVFSMDAEFLRLIVKISAFQQYQESDFDAIKNEIPKLVQEWPELNYRLFWENVNEVRQSVFNKKGESVTEYWQVGNFSCGWSFNSSHFETAANDIVERAHLDDRRMALSLAFHLYTLSNRPKALRERLKLQTAKEEQLKVALAKLLRPPPMAVDTKKWKHQEAKWAKRRREAEGNRRKNEEGWVKWLLKNYEKLDSGSGREVSNSQYYLLERMRRHRGNSSRWAEGNWRDLTAEFGDKVANAFKNGAIKYWRSYKPKLLSEGAEERTTPLGVIFGLAGLAIESGESASWPKALDKKHVHLACRYAFCELNGFPNWFPKLYDCFPDIVSNLVEREIDWELSNQSPQGDRHYILSKVSWGGQWIWDGIAKHLFQALDDGDVGVTNLEGMLQIVQGSSIISDIALGKLASQKCGASNPKSLGNWYAVWIGVDPAMAIEAFSSHLEKMQDKKAAVILAMEVVVNLLGARRSASSSRNKFKTPKYLSDLYLLMHRYIKEEDDIERAGKGAYTPGLRDNAQDGRRQLFSMLSEITGKEAFSAMIELSETHPVEYSRKWMLQSAKKRAETDSDLSALSIEQFNEFSKSLEFIPVNHKELFDLALLRFWDLKYDLEQGDSSNASILTEIKEETEIRKYIGNWCRDKAAARYSIPQEEELADAKRPDLRFHASGLNEPVPVELKLADNWYGPDLFERLENQLCKDYLRDIRSACGLFVLVYRGEKKAWNLPRGTKRVNFCELVEALQAHWDSISNKFPQIDRISVIGIDLTKRMNRVAKRKGSPPAIKRVRKIAKIRKRKIRLKKKEINETRSRKKRSK